MHELEKSIEIAVGYGYYLGWQVAIPTVHGCVSLRFLTYLLNVFFLRELLYSNQSYFYVRLCKLIIVNEYLIFVPTIFFPS